MQYVVTFLSLVEPLIPELVRAGFLFRVSV